MLRGNMTIQHAPTNDALFGPLTDVIKGGSCIAILGAGVSAGDYLLWDKLIQVLQDRCSVRPEESRSDDLLDLAQAAKEKNPDEYHRVLDELFVRKELPKTLNRYHMLARIEFSSYVTLNFDSLLLHTLDLHRNITVSEFPHLKSDHHRGGELFYIHGRLGEDRKASTTSIVLTRTEFNDAYDPNKNRLHAFLQCVFTDYNVCFIGCNPAEPNMTRLLQACESFCSLAHGFVDPARPRWFLLWDNKSQVPDIETSGIKVVSYSKQDQRFSGLDQVLEYWAGRKTPLIRQPGVEESPYATDGELGL